MSIPILSGNEPGLLDPSQPSRLLKNPNSQLLFASFHPHTASPYRQNNNFQPLSLNEELYRPKRVVIEITADGSFWRFVPKARCEDGAKDEGLWPKVVDVCGQIVSCTQDQWDIYMLDPAYTCYIRTAPHTPIITRNSTPEVDHEQIPAATNLKRNISPEHTPPTKKIRESWDSDTDEEDEVEDIVTSEVPPSRATSRAPSAGPSGGYHQQRAKLRAETDQKRKLRRDKIKRRTERSLSDIFEDQVMAELSPAEPPSPPKANSHRMPPPAVPKRKDSFEILEEEQTTKRFRTRSPDSIKRELSGKRAERGKQRAKEKKLKQEQMRRARDEALEAEIYGTYPGQQEDIAAAEAAAAQEAAAAPPPEDDDDDIEEIDPEEAHRQRLIEESRRKIAQLEKDRPLWEEQARKRQMEDDLREREQEAERVASQRKLEAERRDRERAEREAAQRAERERLAREKTIREKKRAQNKSRWARGPWSVARALERYRFLCDQFDAAKYTSSEPLGFDDVPWPMLAMNFTVEDIDWGAVETFFANVKSHMRSQDYKDFVEKSHRRFHPDRWRARGVLKSMQDDEERECIEVAANTVAQALTPLWREVKQ